MADGAETTGQTEDDIELQNVTNVSATAGQTANVPDETTPAGVTGDKKKEKWEDNFQNYKSRTEKSFPEPNRVSRTNVVLIGKSKSPHKYL